MSDVVAFEAQVKGIGNIKDLRQAIKEAKSELLQFEAGTEGFSKAQAKVSALTDKMNGLGDSARIQGTATERLSQSFGLLGESLRGADLEKAKVAFTGIGQAMSAIPIFLLIEGLAALVRNWDAVYDAISSVFGATEKLNKEQQKAIELQERNIYLLEQELELLKIKGATNTQLAEQEKKIAEARLNDKVRIEQLGAALRELVTAQEGLNKATTGPARSYWTDLVDSAKSKVDRLTESMKASALVVAQATINIRKAEAQDAANEAAKKAAQDRLKEAEANAKRIREIEVSELGTIQIEYKTHTEFIKSELDARGAYHLLKLREEEKRREDARKKDLAAEKVQEQARRQIQEVGLNAAKTLSDAFFTFQLSRAKGNQAEELKIRKQMFEVDKAFNVARATQDGIRAVQAALTIPPPGGQILAAANGILAAANVAKILATKFDSGVTASVPDLQSSVSSIPSLPSPTQTRQGTTLLDDFGNPITQQQREQQVIRAYLLDKEVSSKMKNVKRIEEQSKF